MRRWRRTIRKLAVNVLDLPQELVLDVVKLTIIGNMQLSIENHRGVDLFSTELIRLQLTEGKLEIAGHNLSILSILKDEVQVEGTIERVQFIK